LQAYLDEFCYLEDTLGMYWDADSAVTSGIHSGWFKFLSLVPLLTGKDGSLKLCGKVYCACVTRCMLHGSEMRPTIKENEIALQRALKRRLGGHVE